jgi:hypothetical protein
VPTYPDSLSAEHRALLGWENLTAARESLAILSPRPALPSPRAAAVRVRPALKPTANPRGTFNLIGCA